MLGVTRSRLFRIKIPLGLKLKTGHNFSHYNNERLFLANELLLKLIGGLDANAVDFDTPPRSR